jgi:hypothetical protein
MAENKPDTHHAPEEEHFNLEIPEERHEHRDVDIIAIGKVAIGLALLAIAAFAIVIGVFRYLEYATSGLPSRTAAPPTNALERPPAPQLEETPAQDLEREKAAEYQLLHTYGWVDKSAGVVRLPIDRAMDLVAQRGLPSRAAAPPTDNVSVPTEGGLGEKMQQQGGPLAPELGGK